jgi:hypothetical protein
MVEFIPVPTLSLPLSFPRSAWECLPLASAFSRGPRGAWALELKLCSCSLVPRLCVGILPAGLCVRGALHSLAPTLGSSSLVPTLCVGMPPRTLRVHPPSIDPAIPQPPSPPHFAPPTIPSLPAIIPLSRHSLLHSNTSKAQGSPHIRS